MEGPGESSTGSASSLLSSFVIAARFRGIHLTVPQLVHDHLLSSDDVPVSKLIDIAQACGLRAVSARFAWLDLLNLGKALPVIVRLRNGSSMVLLRAEPKAEPPHVVLQDPNAREDAVLALDEYRFAAAWTGEVVLLKRDYRVTADEQPFSLRMIAGLLLQDRRIVRDIAISAFLLSLLAVAPIMFWRLLIDRVLYYQSINTFTVLCVAMAILIAFDTAFGYLRRYMVQIILRRVDAKLSTDIFDKILNLPVEFFERTQTGKIVHDMHEIYKIRSFLTTQLFGTMLDALVLVVFLPIMFFFSALLTFFVLGICAVICLCVVLMLPTIHIKSGRVSEAESRKGSYLVETLQGIRTVKSLALDARRRHDWDVLVANAADRRFDEGCTTNILQTIVAPLGMLMTSGVIALGVYMVITTQENVYVGALVAFMMLTQRVAAPLLQLSFTVQQYDEARIAVGLISSAGEPAARGGPVAEWRANPVRWAR